MTTQRILLNMALVRTAQMILPISMLTYDHFDNDTDFTTINKSKVMIIMIYFNEKF